MKKILPFCFLFFSIYSSSQEHFQGLNNSSRVGIMTSTINPAELINMSNFCEVNVFGLSVNIANNVVGFNDLMSDNFEEKLFLGSKPVNVRLDTQLFLPSVAFKLKRIAIGINTSAKGKLDLVDIDPILGNAIINNNVNNLAISEFISNNYNQRLIGTVWGEVGITGAFHIINNATNRLNAGATFKLLFPGSYSNLGINNFSGDVYTVGTDTYVNNATANLNIAYSGGLSQSFTDFNNYSSSVFGKLNGFCGDIGVNYQWRDQPEDNPKKNKNKYKLNLGLSIRNIGSMTFKDDNNFDTNYQLNIQPTLTRPLGLNLDIFENIDNLSEIETILINEGYLDKTEAEKKSFLVKLPTTLNLYADVKVISKLFVSAFLQQNISDNNANDQITAQNIFNITPRINLGFLEVFAPFNTSDVSGFTSGIGFRLGGFYLGSGSIVTALLNQSKQADIYTGFRWSFL